MVSATDWDRVHRDLSHLIQTAPTNLSNGKLETRQWIARAYAVVLEVDQASANVEFKFAEQEAMRGRIDGHDKLMAVVMRAWAVAERFVPAAAANDSFIATGHAWDAFVSLSKVLQTARSDVLIIDPYMDESALAGFGIAAPERVSLRLLSDSHPNRCRPSLQPAALKWRQQWGDKRPIEIRLAPAESLHDRAIVVDRTTAWNVSQSLKDIAKKSPATVVPFSPETAKLKIDFYEGFWKSASVLV
jgi:hypothetical protein